MGDKIDPLNLEIGLRIKGIRKAKGLSRKELANKASITEQSVLYIETGKRGLSSYTIRGISLALNVTSDLILFGQQDTKDHIDYLSQALVSLTDEEQRSARIVVDTLAEVLRGYDKP
jgi:transcriptional regulator with XRE-family HTH domain